MTLLVSDGADPSRRADAIVAMGRFEDAIPLLHGAIAANPGDPFPRCLLAACLVSIGRHADALAVAEGSLACDPANEWAHRLRSVALRALGRPGEAVVSARESVRLEPEEPLALRQLSRTELAVGNQEAARWAGEEAVRVAPDSVCGYEALGYIALASKDFASAEVSWRKVLELDAENAIAAHNLGVALSGQRKRRAAVECFNLAAKLDPSDEDLCRSLSVSARRYVTGGVVLAGGVWLFLRGASSGARAGPGVLVLVLVGLAAVVGVRAIRRRRRALSLPAETRMLLAEEDRLRRGRRRLLPQRLPAVRRRDLRAMP